MVATSGTVSTYNFTNRKIIDHACRRAGIVPEKLTGEDLEVCLDLLFTLSSEWINAGFPLWTRQFRLLGCQIGSPDVVTPVGTVEILHSYWRIFQPYRGACILGDSTGNNTLFGGQPNPDVTFTVSAPANPNVTVNFTSQTEIDTVGVILGGSASITTALELWTSVDGTTFTFQQKLPSATYLPGRWTYFDLKPTITTQWLRIQYNTQNQGGTWTLNQLQFALANGQDIENGPLNIDDYYNLPNKQFQSDRPNSAYQDRKVPGPVLKIWPTLNTEGFYNGTVSTLMRRHIQDPGTLYQIMEIPQRWYEAMIWRLASRAIDEVSVLKMVGAPDDGQQQSPYAAMAQSQMIQAQRTRCDQMAARSEALVWSEERVRAPIRLMPAITPYTR